MIFVSDILASLGVYSVDKDAPRRKCVTHLNIGETRRIRTDLLLNLLQAKQPGPIARDPPNHHINILNKALEASHSTHT